MKFQEVPPKPGFGLEVFFTEIEARDLVREVHRHPQEDSIVEGAYYQLSRLYDDCDCEYESVYFSPDEIVNLTHDLNNTVDGPKHQWRELDEKFPILREIYKQAHAVMLKNRKESLIHGC